MVRPRMMSRFLTAKSATKLRSSSVPRKRILVSLTRQEQSILFLTIIDVIVLTSMGEEVAIEAKEAPRGA